MKKIGTTEASWLRNIVTNHEMQYTIAKFTIFFQYFIAQNLQT